MFEGTAEHEVLAVTVNTYSVGILCYSYIISRHWPFAVSFQAMLCSCKIIVPVHQKNAMAQVTHFRCTLSWPLGHVFCRGVLRRKDKADKDIHVDPKESN